MTRLIVELTFNIDFRYRLNLIISSIDIESKSELIFDFLVSYRIESTLVYRLYIGSNCQDIKDDIISLKD